MFAEISTLAGEGRWDEIESYIDEHPEVVGITDESDTTLLIMLSNFAGSGRLLQKLIYMGADVNQINNEGESALTYAILGGSNYGLTTLPELKILLEAGADVGMKGPSGNPPLHWAIIHNRLDHAEMLLTFGADPNQKTSDLEPESAFEIARSNSNQKAIELLAMKKV